VKGHEDPRSAELAAAITSLASAAAALSSQAQRLSELLAADTGTSRGALASLDQPEQSQTEMKLVLTPAEFAALLGVHPRTLQRMRAAGEGPKPITIGKTLRYRRRDVERWLEGKRS
jgi:excisionase family DNA binding protein